MTNINITLPEELHRCLKIRAVEENKTLKGLVIELLIATMKHDKSL